LKRQPFMERHGTAGPVLELNSRPVVRLTSMTSRSTVEKSGGQKCCAYYLRSELRVWFLRVVPELPKRHRSSRFRWLPPQASITRPTCNGVGAAGVTVGADCAVAVAQAGALAGVPGALALVGAVAPDGVGTAGVTAGAVCIAGGDFKPPA
jgi:hypothetical protein